MLAVGERRCMILKLLGLNFLIRDGMGFERRCGFLGCWFLGGEERKAGEEGMGLLFVLVQSSIMVEQLYLPAEVFAS